jgi:hypothetical protein
MSAVLDRHLDIAHSPDQAVLGSMAFDVAQRQLDGVELRFSSGEEQQLHVGTHGAVEHNDGCCCVARRPCQQAREKNIASPVRHHPLVHLLAWM